MAFKSTSFPSDSVRHRVLRRISSKINPSDSESDLPPLKPGEMQLYSYFTPGISTGLYDIIAEQTIHTSDGSQSKTIKALDQSFFVYAPKYSIDPALIHSIFPHQGVAAQANILPHVVLNDPHLPWQTEIGKTSEKDTLRIPWLAVIAFEQSELKLQPDDPLFPPGITCPPQSFTMATRLTVGQVISSGFHCALPNLSDDLLEDPKLSSQLIDVIFPEMDLFLALFGGGTSETPQIDVDRYKYLAHARQVNTTHMADSGVLDEGKFSIVFSHRTGPPFEKDASPEPKRCVAHLVSLDWVHRIPTSDLKSNKRAALISLYSWTYDCIPPETVNFEDVMRAVGRNNEVFRTPDEIRNKVNKDLPLAVHNRIKDRLDDGYTLVRYRVQTGEETYALMRGPLTPYAVPEATWMDIHSNTGEDLQIIDTQLGLMDISYSAAWQLGKSLAIADQAFCASVIRIRADVYDKSSEKAKEKVLSKKYEDATSERVIDSLPQHFSVMKQLSKQPFDQQRWNRPPLIQTRYELLAENKDSGDYKEAMELHLRQQVKHLTSATDGTHYTEAKDPLSTDWDLVLNWILDKIYLDRVPPWYLIPDPTWLPTESIRFFYVDHKWLSALIDGALSVANHLDEKDKVRQAIKDELLKYLNEEIHRELKHPPQVPSYGFYLRSVVVDAFPDLVVRAPWPPIGVDKEDPRAEVLRQENVRKDIMFCLLDRTPGSKNLQKLILSQPPHQQCFMFGHDSTFTSDSFDLELRKVYSVHTDKSMDELPKQSFSKGEDGRCDIYDWNTRTIRVDKFASLVSSTLDEAHKQDSDIYDGAANASLLGIQLNDPIYRLTFFSPTRLSAASDIPVFSFPGKAGPSTVQRISPNYARPFKGVARPRPRPLPRGLPRRSGFPQPILATAPADVPRKLRTPQSKLVSASATSTVETSILSEIDYDDMEKCSSRFSPNCFPIGSPSSAGDGDPKYLTSSLNGTDVIVRLSRNQADLDSTDSIRLFEIRVPLGTTSDRLFTKPLEMDSVEILNTMRFVTDFGVNDDGDEIIIHLQPKAVIETSPLSHNPDMSIMIKGAHVNSEARDTTISIVELYKSKQGNLKIALNYIKHVQVQAKN